MNESLRPKTVKRLNEDIAFNLICGFLVSDNTPSEASYSRLITNYQLEELDILEAAQEEVTTQAIAEGFITDERLPSMPRILKPGARHL